MYNWLSCSINIILTSRLDQSLRIKLLPVRFLRQGREYECFDMIKLSSRVAKRTKGVIWMPKFSGHMQLCMEGTNYKRVGASDRVSSA